MKRIGLMGCGVVADYGHLPALRESPGLELVAAFDPSPMALEKVASRFPNAQRHTDSTAFFMAGKEAGMEGVIVASPAPAHFSNVRQAAEYGLHVLCEKPLGMNEAEIEQMIAWMDGAGKSLTTAFCYRFSPVAVKIRELVRDGIIGEVRALRLIYLWDLHGKYVYNPDGTRYESPRRIGRMQEGGPMVDCGVHQIDLSLFWLDSPVARQTATAAWIDTDYDAPDHVWLHLDHESGAHSHIEMSFSYCHTAKEPVNTFTYELIGTEGIIKYNRDGWLFEIRTNKGSYWLPGASEKNFAGMHAAWREALETGDFSGLPSARHGLSVSRIAQNATEAVMAARPRTEKQSQKF